MHNFNSKNRGNSDHYDQPLANGKRSYNFMNMQKSIEISDTDKRIQQIKRKYDTPNRRQRISQLSVKKHDSINKQNDNYGTADFKTRSFINAVPHTEGNQSSLQDSQAMNNSRQKFFNNSSFASKSILPERTVRQVQSYENKYAANRYSRNENEQEFFKRVKQMKQSLLYGQNPNKPSQGRESNVQNKQSRQKSSYYDSNKNVEKDRIDNIDKINQKIKGILQCLNENQKTKIPSKYADFPKKGKQTSVLQKQFHNRDLTMTPIKNALSSSIMGRSTFGNHRHERSQILEKISVNRELNNDQSKRPSERDDQKWEKLSNKLEKYEVENKLRIQKALDTTKQLQIEAGQRTNLVQNMRKNLVQNTRNNRSFYQPPFEEKKAVQVVRRDNRSVDFRDLRSRSIISPKIGHIKQSRDRDLSLHAGEATVARQYEMRSGKKLDDEIGRIQKKIQQFEEQKKRLNINFKPFNYSNTKSTSNLGLNNVRCDFSQKKISEFTRSLYKNDKKQNQQQRNRYQHKLPENLQNQSTFREKKESFRDRFQENQQANLLESKIQIKLQKSNPSSVRTSKFISQHSSRGSNDKEEDQSYAVQHETKQDIQLKSTDKQFVYFFDESIKKRTDDGIEERRRKLLNSSQNIEAKNTELKSLVKFLCEQVRLDEDFRNAKIWYDYNDNSKKEGQIKKLLPQKNFEEIRQILKVRQSQNNPFFTTQGYESTFSRLVDLYKQSESHWKQKIWRKFDKLSLQSQGFTCKEIDLQKKGHINLGDLVRFLNLQSGTFYRNRDLALILIRICREHNSTSYTQVSFNWLSDAFCA